MSKKSTAPKPRRHTRKPAAPVRDALDEWRPEPDAHDGEEGIDLAAVVEAERITLLEAHSLMKCLQAVLLDSGLDEGLFYSDLASVAARIVDGSVARLDDTCIKPMIEVSKGSTRPSTALRGRASSVGKLQVREGQPAYLC